MRVGSDQEQAGQGKTLLGKYLMADAAAAIEEMGDLLLAHPGPHIPLQFRRCLVVCRNYVVKGYDNPLFIPNPLRAHLLKGPDG